jgi:hypothetical protein
VVYSRLMVIVFTSTAFNNWVATHVQVTNGTSFNPYLTFLFYALYVFTVYFFGSPTKFIFLQCWIIRSPFPGFVNIPHFPTIRLLSRSLRFVFSFGFKSLLSLTLYLLLRSKVSTLYPLQFCLVGHFAHTHCPVRGYSTSPGPEGLQ